MVERTAQTAVRMGGEVKEDVKEAQQAVWMEEAGLEDGQEAEAGSQHAAREAKATVALPAASVAAEGVDAQAGTVGV